MRQGVGHDASRFVSMRTSRPHPRQVRRATAWLRRSTRHLPRSSTATPVSPGLDRIASIQRHRPWCFSLRVAQSFSAVRRWSSNNVGPATMPHPDSWSPCGRAPQAPSAKATAPDPHPQGCGRRRRRSTRIAPVPRPHRPVSLATSRDADGAPQAPPVIPRHQTIVACSSPPPPSLDRRDRKRGPHTVSFTAPS
jgi:hypothetical protein